MRITKKQKQIFEAHLDAFMKDKFDVSNFSKPNDSGNDSPNRLQELLLSGKTCRSLWDYIWENNVSIESQLMASNKVFGFVSEKAKKDSRIGFKEFLNKPMINIR